ncbi:MAG: DUF2141 domain-containing protein [Rhodospirillales bacterium]
MGRHFVFRVFLLLGLLWPGAATAATLEVEIVGLASDKGDVHVALYDNPDTFPDSDGMRTKTEVLPEGRIARATFRDLPPGRYAIAVYHDENGNDEFDQGFLGIPLEDYGFSNDAAVFLGPPSFGDAAFDVTEPSVSIRINLGT